MSYINRAVEQLLKRKFLNSKSVAVTGARQVGKSTLIKHLYPNMARYNFKNPTLVINAKNDPESFMNSIPRPSFLDEIQEVPELLSMSKVILDEIGGKENYIFSGSQKWSLMSGLADSLAGFVSILDLSNLSMREIYGITFNEHFLPNDEYLSKREKHIKPYNDIWKTIHRGFYPELYENKEKEWEEFYSDYIKTYIERDVYKITRIRDFETFYKFMVSVAARTGSILDYKNIANDIGVSLDTVKTWLGILEKTDIVLLLRPYYNSHLNRAIKTPKVYFRDTGLAAYLTSWLTPENLQNGAMSGAFFETFVINEIVKSFSNVGKDYSRYVYYYRGKDKIRNKKSDENTGKAEYIESEIDLIIEENGMLYPIEIKKNTNPSASDASAFDVLDKDIDKKRGAGAIICSSKYKLKLGDNLYMIPLEYI